MTKKTPKNQSAQGLKPDCLSFYGGVRLNAVSIDNSFD